MWKHKTPPAIGSNVTRCYVQDEVSHVDTVRELVIQPAKEVIHQLSPPIVKSMPLHAQGPLFKTTRA